MPNRMKTHENKSKKLERKRMENKSIKGAKNDSCIPYEVQQQASAGWYGVIEAPAKHLWCNSQGQVSSGQIL